MNVTLFVDVVVARGHGFGTTTTTRARARATSERARARASARRRSLEDDRGDGNDDERVDDVSSSFAEEVARRRRMSGENASDGGKANPFARRTDGGEFERPRFSPSARRDDEKGSGRYGDDQLARSRAMQGEGLEGFPARAEQLVKLGFATFLGFGPFIAAISVVFCVTYLLFGSDFIHSGEGYAGSPAFVPAEVLLAEPTVDATVPFSRFDATTRRSNHN